MKKFILICCFLTSCPLFADYRVRCSGYGEQRTFELEGEVELAGGSYIDAWVSFKAYAGGELVHQSKRNVFSYGMIFFDRINATTVKVAELRPSDSSLYSRLYLAMDHPLPSGNSWLELEGVVYLAECISR